MASVLCSVPSVKPGQPFPRGDAQGGIQRSVLNPLLWGGRPVLAAWGEPTPPRRPLGGNEKGGSDSLMSWDNRDAVPRSTNRKRNPDLSDSQVREILVHAMADVGADPALVYAFQNTGVYVCDENEKRLPKEKLKAFDGAVDEYLAAIKRPPQ
jgi:hypothetical protein